MVEPFRTIAENMGMVEVASNYAVTHPSLDIAMYFASQEYAEENPEVVEAFTAAMNRSLDYAQENPDAVREVLGTYTQIEPDVQSAVVLPRWTSEIDRDALQVLAELAQADGLFEEIPDLDVLLPR